MGVAAQILQHVFRTTEGAFEIDHPVLSVEWPEPGGEGLGLSQRFQVSPKAELVAVEGLLESGDKLAAKDFLQHRLRKKVVPWGANPVGVIEGKAPGGNDTMDMGMKTPTLTIP